MTAKREINKVEFKKMLDGSVGVHYFDHDKKASYHAWTLPTSVAKRLVSWWKGLNKEKCMRLPIKEWSASCAFTMHTENYIDIEECITPGCNKKNFWTLSIDTLEELVILAEKKT